MIPGGQISISPAENRAFYLWKKLWNARTMCRYSLETGGQWSGIHDPSADNSIYFN